MRDLSLAEILKVYRDQGHSYFSLAPKGGEFEVAMYSVPDARLAATDPDAWRQGSRDFREVKHNLVTKFLSMHALNWNNQLSATPYLAISPDTDQPHFLKTLYRATYQGATAAASSFAIDTVSRLWTITGTILAPAAGKTRTFQTVMVGNDTWTNQGNSSIGTGIFAATRLSSPRTQDETQQVVVSYRLSWEEGSDV